MPGFPLISFAGLTGVVPLNDLDNNFQAVIPVQAGKNGLLLGTDGTNPLWQYPVLTVLTNSLGADVALNNVANYFDGPAVAQGVVGTWLALGTVTLLDKQVGDTEFDVKLWDGTTVIASAVVAAPNTYGIIAVSLSGFLATPGGNLRISVKDLSSTSGKIIFNGSGNSKDSTITAVRIA